MRRWPDRLRADFQQYYGLDLDGMGTAYSMAHAADLAANLPPDSRCGVAEDPLNGWTRDQCLLALIEYRLHEWNWAHTKDAKTGANRPELLIPLPEGRQGDGADSPVAMTVDEMMEFVGGLVGGNGGEDV